jgi:very-short-patch-repair endonuclease
MKHQPRDLDAPIRQYARRMRREQTQAERALWSMLRGRSLSRWKFRRQHPVAFFVLDFYCPELKLAIELDGQPHFETGSADADTARTAELETLGITLIRFENGDLLENSSIVLNRILDATKRIAAGRA